MKNEKAITPEEYKALQAKLMEVACTIRNLEKLPEFIQAIERSEATAPLFNPTLYMVGRSKLELVKRTAHAINRARAALPTLQQYIDAELATKRAADMAGVDPSLLARVPEE